MDELNERGESRLRTAKRMLRGYFRYPEGGEDPKSFHQRKRAALIEVVEAARAEVQGNTSGDPAKRDACANCGALDWAVTAGVAIAGNVENKHLVLPPSGRTCLHCGRREYVTAKGWEALGPECMGKGANECATPAVTDLEDEAMKIISSVNGGILEKQMPFWVEKARKWQDDFAAKLRTTNSVDVNEAAEVSDSLEDAVEPESANGGRSLKCVGVRGRYCSESSVEGRNMCAVCAKIDANEGNWG